MKKGAGKNYAKSETNIRGVSKYKLKLFFLVWTCLQFALTFFGSPIVFISDEIMYARIAYSLFQFKPAISWHYPVLYPMLISVGFFFGNYFYEMMLIVNILFKGICLIIIYNLLKRTTDARRAFLILILIGFSPIYFLYSRVILSENLACPLLIINVLFHEIYRKKMIDDSVSKKRKLVYLIGAALLSLALYWTKYLMLITLPIFCLFWCEIYFKNVERNCFRKYKKFFLAALMYTFTVLVCILGYAIIYALRLKMPFSMELLLGTMGFTIGSGPSNNGYAVLVDFKWVVCYTLYALLGGALIIVGIVIKINRRLLKEHREIIVLSAVLVLGLIYISARHSTYVNYNEGGKMMNLCGRYVAYATPLLAICWVRIFDFAKSESIRLSRKISGGLIGSCIVWVAYEWLYVFSPGVTQSTSWLTGIRAAENAGFTNLGVSMCWLFCMGIVILLFSDYKIGIAAILLLMNINSFAAILTSEQYHHKDYAQSRVIKEINSRYKEDSVVVICTNAGDYNTLLNRTLFYKLGGGFDNFSVWSIENMKQPLFINEDSRYLFFVSLESLDSNAYADNTDLYEGDIEHEDVFLMWDRSRFKESSREIEMSQLDEGQIELSCEGNEKTIFICGTYILPVKVEGDTITATVTTNLLSSGYDTVYIYNLENLTVNNFKLVR